jgi:hypothetical protein
MRALLMWTTFLESMQMYERIFPGATAHVLLWLPLAKQRSSGVWFGSASNFVRIVSKWFWSARMASYEFANPFSSSTASASSYESPQEEREGTTRNVGECKTENLAHTEQYMMSDLFLRVAQLPVRREFEIVIAWGRLHIRHGEEVEGRVGRDTIVVNQMEQGRAAKWGL